MAVSDERSLRSQVYRGGRYLVARQLSGMLVKVLGILAVTRLIGPESYGLYAAAAAIGAVLSTMAIFGTDVHLVRNLPAKPVAEHTAFTMLLVSSLVLAVAGFAAAPILGTWLGSADATAPMRVVAGMLPIVVLSVPARARLERRFEFAALAGIEFGADIAVYGVAIPMAALGFGVWAPIGGFAARHVTILFSTYALSRYRPQIMLDRDELGSIGNFGAGYSAGKWLSLAGQLINPIIVGRLLGPVGVGHVAMTSRIIEQLGAVKQATVRLATAAFARLDGDRDRLRAAHSEGVLVQVLGSVPLYAAAAFTGPYLLPALFGSAWEPAVDLLALLAIAASVGTLFNLAAPILRVLDRNAPVARLRAWQVSSLVLVTTITVPTFGVAGYGFARLARTIPFVVANRAMSREFTPTYLAGFRWLLAFLPMMFSPWCPAILRPVLLLGPVAMTASTTGRRELTEVVKRATKFD